MNPLRHKFLEQFKTALQTQPCSVPTTCASKGEFDFSSEILPECASSFLFFNNGHFEPERSNYSALSSCVVLPFEKAWKTYGLLLHNRISQELKDEKDALALLNGAMHPSGLFFYVPPQCSVSVPVQILSLSSSSDLVAPRIYLLLGKGASLTLIDLARGDGFCINHREFHLEESSSLSLAECASGTQFHYSLRAHLARSAQLSSTSYSSGSVRQNLKVSLNGESSSAEFRGLFDLREKKEAHVNMLMEHQAPHCHSRQHFKFVHQDQSRSTFEGKIYVHPAAQKTESYQLNQNLLLSEEASASSKPNLEIFADDVKASHGATFSQLSEEDLFYFCSRGLSPHEAKEILRKGFCQEILNFFPLPSLRTP